MTMQLNSFRRTVAVFGSLLFTVVIVAASNPVLPVA